MVRHIHTHTIGITAFSMNGIHIYRKKNTLWTVFFVLPGEAYKQKMHASQLGLGQVEIKTQTDGKKNNKKYM